MDTEVDGKRQCQNCGTWVDIRIHCDGCDEELCESCHNDHQNGCDECNSDRCGHCGSPVDELVGGNIIVQEVDSRGGTPVELERFCGRGCYDAEKGAPP